MKTGTERSVHDKKRRENRNLSSARRERERKQKKHSRVNQFLVKMVSFHQLQGLVLFCHAQGILDDEELLLLLLYEEYSPKNHVFFWFIADITKREDKYVYFF